MLGYIMMFGLYNEDGLFILNFSWLKTLICAGLSGTGFFVCQRILNFTETDNVNVYSTIMPVLYSKSSSLELGDGIVYIWIRYKQSTSCNLLYIRISLYMSIM